MAGQGAGAFGRCGGLKESRGSTLVSRKYHNEPVVVVIEGCRCSLMPAWSDQIPFERAYELWEDKIFLRHFDPRFPDQASWWRPYTRDELYEGIKHANASVSERCSIS